MHGPFRRKVGLVRDVNYESLRRIACLELVNHLFRSLFPLQAIDLDVVNRDTFNPAQMYVLSLMEKESLAGFLKSDVHATLKKRIADGEMEALVKEDSENVKDVMSKEVRI